MDTNDLIGTVISLAFFGGTILFGIYFFGRIWLETNGTLDRIRYNLRKRKENKKKS